jgi:iron complex transport system substrate-binding protein
LRHEEISPGKKNGGVVTFVLLCALLGCGRRSPSQGEVKRIVALTPSATELVHALDADALLVGVDEYSTFPPSVAGLPKVGTFLSPDFEAIVRLKPDLVITDDIHEDVAAALRDAGIETLTAPMHSLPDVRAGLEKVAVRIGRPEVGKRVVEEIDAAVDEIGLRKHDEAPRVLAVIDREQGGLGNLVAAGPGSWIDELLAVVGARNVLAASGVRYPKLSPEDILREAPEVIVDASYVATPERAVADWDRVHSIPAVRNRAIHVLKEPYFLSPSPRIAQALRELEAALYGRGTDGR